MRLQTVRRWGSGMAVVGMLAGTAALAPRLQAQLSQGDLNTPDVIRAALEQQIGKRVKLKLVSGQDLEGQVSRVGSAGVLLTELSGLEFYDATIRLDQIAAVIVRRPR